ncbi:MAPEG family protein [Marinobacter litoralis]|uniref:MAPEG family protein n=1 Tax=Marinobacter litoralis TaxID=187981 RepID=UPI0018EAF5F1|nr:MAPEG family protein [Marinobacter litoralis]MBJ6136544.1 MAPEG family protein [Marinobacter litoralis]
MIIPVTAVFAAVLGILLLVLSAMVVRCRLKHQVGMGVNENRVFQATVRAHANLVEYAPFALIMLAIAELNGVSSTWIYWSGMALVVGRILHAFGMIKGKGKTHMGRLVGTILTWLSILVTAILLLWNVGTVYG